MDMFYKDVLPYQEKKCILAYNLSLKEKNIIKKIVSDKFNFTETDIFTDILAVPSVGVFIEPSGISESKLTCLFEYYIEGHSVERDWVLVFMQPVTTHITLKESPIYVYKENNLSKIYEQLCHVADLY